MDLGGASWRFVTPDEKLPGENVTMDPINGVQNIKELYLLADPHYSGRFSVPVLWDKKLKTIVSNESSEIIRMLNTEFDELLTEEFRGVNIVPEELREKIDEINTWIYDDLNNGVYKSGIAKTQEAHEKAVTAVFGSLDRIESILKSTPGPYLLGSQLTEVDVRLYPTIVRFDVVYVTLFKTNLSTIRDGYPKIHRWLQHLYWDIPAFKETTSFEHIKKHYFTSLTPVNPDGIVPLGPLPNIREK
jgi:putative glutathione S-transferase